ncbi:MAG: L-aspartate oxidase [Candidatus Glassbacteria bacterium]
MEYKVEKADFVVIGSGMAGLTFALKASKWGTVTVLTKKENRESSTNYAQGGIAAVIGEDDSFELHIKDTLRAGAGLCKEEMVEIMVREGPSKIRELIDWGVTFSMERLEGGELKLSLGMEGGHSKRRIVRADDLTGQAIENALLKKLEEAENVNILEDHIALDLVVREENGRNRCSGVLVFNSAEEEFVFCLGKIVLLATGGVGRAYLHTTNPRIATGDGIAMAYRAGAIIANMEFIQFHPTVLYPVGEDPLLITEAIRGEGAFLKRVDGTTFMENYHSQGCLAPRDIVARAIDRELKSSGNKYVYLDLSPIMPKRIKSRFPNITLECLTRGYDITNEPIPVVPAAHYVCGGVVTDEYGQTSIDNLFAAGEVACTGVHGANRLASNSLLEAVVFSDRAACKARTCLDQESDTQTRLPEDLVPSGKSELEAVLISHNSERIRSLMWDYVGIVRSDQRLSKAWKRIKLMKEEIEEYYNQGKMSSELIELRNMTTAAELIVRSALSRKESRGLHYNIDYPAQDDEHYHCDTIIARER